jgi:hypothetical protein
MPEQLRYSKETIVLGHPVFNGCIAYIKLGERVKLIGIKSVMALPLGLSFFNRTRHAMEVISFICRLTRSIPAVDPGLMVEAI